MIELHYVSAVSLGTVFIMCMYEGYGVVAASVFACFICAVCTFIASFVI